MASDVERIKEKLPIEEIIGGYVSLERSGNQCKGRCPFHNEKTPSFYVSPDRGTYYCFGCGAKGDIFSFVQEYERLDFRGALKMLADKAGITLTSGPSTDTSGPLYDVLERATKFFEHHLEKNDDAKKYLIDRGLTPETIARFRIGFAPDSWEQLSLAAVKSGMDIHLLERAGLVKPSPKKAGSYYDRFRSRIMFPLFDLSGRVVGFSGRIIGQTVEEESAKYLNSPETEVFKKSSVLYGLHLAKEEARKTRTLHFVEGQFDLVLSHQAGLTTAVATSGTAFTIDHAHIAARYADTLICAFDADEAGNKAAIKSAHIALAAGLDVRMITVLGGKDPADMVRADPASWITATQNHIHVIEFALNYAKAHSVDERSYAREIETIVAPLIARIQRPLDRAHFVRLVSGKTGIAESHIDESVSRAAMMLAKNDPYLSHEQHSAQSPMSREALRETNQNRTRLERIEEEVVGLLYWLGHADTPSRADILSTLKAAADDTELLSSFTTLEELAKDPPDHIKFKAEASFAGNTKLEIEINSLVTAYKQELYKQALSDTLTRLRKAEAEKDPVVIQYLLQRSQKYAGQLHQVKKSL